MRPGTYYAGADKAQVLTSSIQKVKPMMRIAHHYLHHQQELAAEAASAAQDEAFFEAQLLRTISLVLSAVGFDSVKPTALEAFRAEVEQCAPVKRFLRC